MTDPTTAARSRRYRERQAGRLPPVERPTCQCCGIVHTGARGLLCSRCWQATTVEGRADRAARVKKAMQRKRVSTGQ
jgi:hypothetical protein